MSACPFLTKAGTPCQRYVKPGAVACFCHDPARSAERARQQANVRLGWSRRRAIRAAEVRAEILRIAAEDKE